MFAIMNMSAKRNLTTWWNKTKTKEYCFMINLHGKNVLGNLNKNHRKMISLVLDEETSQSDPLQQLENGFKYF